MDVRRSILLRARVAFLGTFLVGILVTGRIAYIQRIQGAHWTRAAGTLGLVYEPIKATRGNIYGSDGSLLATSLPLYRVALDPCVVKEATFQAQITPLSVRLAHLYRDKSPDAYQKLIQEARQAKRRYIVLNKKRIDYATKQKMEQWPIFCLGRFGGGVIFEKVERRFRPFYDLAARTLGYVNASEHGAGLEYSFNKVLRGTDGQALYQKIVGGRKMLHNSATLQPIHGYDLETTLDINLQDVAHASLMRAVQASNAAYGCVIVMEVKTGEIKAIVNLSHTDSGRYEERYNYAIGSHGTMEPGSTLKLASMLALLEDTPLKLTDTIDTGNGRYRFRDRIMEDVQKGGYGELTIQEVFEKSSNIGVARLIDDTFGAHPQKFIDYLVKLNLDRPVGLRIIGEGKPLIRNPQSPQWDGVTLPWMSIGYAMQVTPLHILNLYNAVANDGIMVRPQLVKNIKQANRTVHSFPREVLNAKICSEETLQKLRILLEGVVERGTARSFRHSFYQIAGKTGTAHKAAVGGRGYTQDTHASFVGYFPAKTPQYSCIVVLDAPKTYAWRFGSAGAAVVKDIADKIASKDLISSTELSTSAVVLPKGVFPLIRAGNREDLSKLCDELNVAHQAAPLVTPWVRSTIAGEQIVWKDNGALKPGQVPHVQGMTLRDALFLLEQAGLRVTVKGDKSGRVATQSLAPGATAKMIAITMAP